MVVAALCVVYEAVLVLDVGVKLLTAYESDGVVVRGRSAIAARYMRSGAIVIDLLSSLPYIGP